jgi:hypothetical protein
MTELLFFFLLCAASSQLTAIDSSLNFNISLYTTLPLYQPTGSSTPSLIILQKSNTYIYTLASNNVLQIYARSDPAISIYNDTTYFNNTGLTFVYLEVDVT